ncbi:putative ATPase of the ABC class [Musa troglodytarum]|uniref:ATPase of the ABC class n=1 Tax=Musa troglodytarum TaxID=320322 RepID=A0A9E7EKC9_9LILI|nr:putative ATPase of the ABC class [Musa troglodytarum]
MRGCHPGRCQDHQQTRRRGNGPEQWRKKGEAGGIDGKDGDTGKAEVEEDREGTDQYRSKSGINKKDAPGVLKRFIEERTAFVWRMAPEPCHE